MDDDVSSLHGVPASDSGCSTSTASRSHVKRKYGSHSTVRSSASTAGTSISGLNARFERFTREMEEVADASITGEGAGRSLGVKRKKIAHRPLEHLQLGGVEGRAAEPPGRQQVEEQQPKSKRRRSIPPRQPPLRGRRLPDEAEGGEQEGEPPLWLSRSDPLPARTFSPKPLWLSRYFAGTPVPDERPPMATPLPAQPLGSGLDSGPSRSSLVSLPPFEDDSYEPPPSPASAFSTSLHPHQQQQLHPFEHTPLPFSTNGRLARPASRMTAFSPHPQESLYESQLARASDSFRSPREEDIPLHQGLPFSAQPANYLTYHAPPTDVSSHDPYSTGNQAPLPLSPAFCGSTAWMAEPSFHHQNEQQQQDSRLHDAHECPAWSGQGFNSPQLFLFASSSSHTLFEPLSPERSCGHSYHYHSLTGEAAPPLAYDAVDALEPNVPVGSSFWSKPDVPRLTAEGGRRPTLHPGQLRFARRLEEAAASQLDKNSRSEVDTLLRQPDGGGAPPASGSGSKFSQSPFLICRTPSQPCASPALSAARSPANQYSERSLKSTAENENRLPSPSLRRYLPDANAANREGTPEASQQKYAAQFDLAMGQEPRRLSRSRTAMLRADEGIDGRGMEGTPSPRGSPLDTLVEGSRQRGDRFVVVGESGQSKEVDDEKGILQEEDGKEEEEVVKFDWDVIGEGGRLLDALMEEGERQAQVKGNGAGEDAFEFYEDQEDPVEE
ncbi:hypothetical protein JCM11251_002407 [Rhodosporidiobolus azoricus]